MRAWLASSVLIGLCPAAALAHPMAVARPASLVGIASGPADDPTAEEPPPYEATSSKAPASAALPPTQPEPEPAAEPEPSAEVDPSTSLESERGRARSRSFNRHGIGVRGGITVVPTWILAKYLDTHSNALCRGDSIGNFAAERGLLRTDGCNFYTALEYVYRQSRILDIDGVIGYQRLHSPDAFWLDKGQAAVNGLGGADYTEIKMDIMTMQVDFIARAPIVVRDDVELGIGGGGGLGLGIVFGGVWQTPLGDLPRGYDDGVVDENSCLEQADLADFNRCTPRFDATENGADPNFNFNDLSDPNPQGFATCGADGCNTRDLDRFGYRKKNSDVPPVIPIVNLALSARVIIKDVFGITLTGGWNTGFYFGGSLNYFFGKQFQTDRSTGPAPSK